ncbi:MAG TPA: M23 family metallopeptidase [Chloroflexi bacterium]|nr:M23 family metallopeptidase [Chloroflexota bacterium]
MLDNEPTTGYAVQIIIIALLLIALLVVALSSGFVRLPFGRSSAENVPPEEVEGVALTTPAADATIAPTPTLDGALAADHYWLERPIAADANDAVDRLYPYGSRGDGTYPVHHGVEFMNPEGTPVLAVAPGTVIVAGDDSRRAYDASPDYYGLLVVLQLDLDLDGEPLYALYGHLSEIDVQEGQRVETGDVLGRVGMTGIATGPHLHFEVRHSRNDYGQTLNPELWLRPRPGRGTLAGQVVTYDGEPAAEVGVRLYRAGADIPVDEAFTYPARGVNPDPHRGENLLFGDLSAGDWTIQIEHRGQIYNRSFTIEAGHTTWITVELSR